MRVVLGVEYDGQEFAGWQWQPGRRTVQAELEAALSRVASQPVRVVCAGRTDAGVHALEQVVHFDCAVERAPRSWLMGANSALPVDVRVLWVREMPLEFHARYSAIARYYRYTILNRPMRSALLRRQVTWSFLPLDAERMNLAARHLIGNRDFTSFRAKDCQSVSPWRYLHFLDVHRDADRVHIDVCANAFLHHMVRNLAGLLMAIGGGKHEPDWAAEVLAARDRSLAAATAPADGLYFAAVCYPDPFGMPRHPVFARLPPDAARFSPAEPE